MGITHTTLTPSVIILIGRRIPLHYLYRGGVNGRIKHFRHYRLKTCLALDYENLDEEFVEVAKKFLTGTLNNI